MLYNEDTAPLRQFLAKKDETCMGGRHMSNLEKSVLEPLVLAQDVVRFGGMQLLYSLAVKKSDPSNRFEISISKDGEVATAEAGESLELALESYRSIVLGIVTPCTLDDVMKDFEYSRTKLRKKLYKRAFL